MNNQHSNQYSMPVSTKLKPLVLAMSLATLTLSGTAVAQTDDGEQVTKVKQIETIEVTARKRTETIMETPLSITAVTGAAMDNQGITNLEQMATKVPGLQIGRAAQTSNIFIRGIGSGINRAFEQSAGMYVDGIYQSRSRQFTQSLVDLQQVEILRGPQGTLFGKNTIAGAIKVETATTEPGEDFGGYISLDNEWEQNTNRVTGVVYGSPTDTLGARLAVRYQESDGYVDNMVWNRDEAQKEDTLVRLSLAWQAADNVKVVTKVTHTNMENKGFEVVNFSDPSLLEGFFAGTNQLGLFDAVGSIAAYAAPGYPGAIDELGYDTWSANTGFNDGDFENTESTAVSVRIDWDLSDYTVTSITGFSDFEFEQDHDTDFHGGNFVHNIDNEELTSYSQELRLASNFDGKFNFLVGVYYENQDFNDQANAYLDGSLGGVWGELPAAAFFPAPGQLKDYGLTSMFIGDLWDPSFAGQGYQYGWRDARMEQDTETTAIFAEFMYDITDDLTLELGARYSEDSKDATKFSSIGTGNIDERVPTHFDDRTVNPAVTPEFATFNAFIWSQFSTYPFIQPLSRDEEHFDPSVRLRWTPTDNTMAYVSWSEGYKSGGINSTPDTGLPDGSPGPDTYFEDEAAEAWEIGVKTTQWDGRAQFSATAFQTDIDDLQVTSWTGVKFAVGNAAELTVKGIELETKIMVLDSLEIGGSLSYLDHEFGSYNNASPTIYQIAQGEADQDLSGQRGAFAPEYSGTLYADWGMQISDMFWFSANVDLTYKDEYYADGDLDPITLQDASTKVNARLSLATLDDIWEVSIFGRNLTDETTMTAAVDAPLSAGIWAAYVEEPRVFGVQLKYNFGL